MPAFKRSTINFQEQSKKGGDFPSRYRNGEAIHLHSVAFWIAWSATLLAMTRERWVPAYAGTSGLAPLTHQHRDGESGAERHQRGGEPQRADQKPNGPWLTQGRRRRIDPGFELRLGAAQGRRRTLDGCDFALEVLAIDRGQQAGVIRIGSPTRAPVDCGRVARRCVSRRCGGRIGERKSSG